MNYLYKALKIINIELFNIYFLNLKQQQVRAVEIDDAIGSSMRTTITVVYGNNLTNV